MLVSEKEIEDQYRKQNLTAKIDFVKFDVSSKTKDCSRHRKNFEPTMIRTRMIFKQASRRKVQYLWVSHQSEKNKVQISEPKLKEFYDQNKSRFPNPKQVKARHISIKNG